MLTVDKICRDEKFLEFLRTNPHYVNYYNIVKQKDPHIVRGFSFRMLLDLYSLFTFLTGGGKVATISIVNPTPDFPVVSGEKAKIVLSLAATDLWTLIENSKVVIRDEHGNEVFNASARFSDGNAEVPITWMKEGSYSIQVTCRNIFNSVIALATSTFIISEKSKDENQFHSV